MSTNDRQAAARELRAAYRRLIQRRITIALTGAGLLALSFLIDLATGPSFLALDQVFMTLLGQSDDRGVETIVCGLFGFPLRSWPCLSEHRWEPPGF